MKRCATTSVVSESSSIIIDNDSMESEDSDKDICNMYFTFKNKAPSGSLGNPVAIDDDGLVVNVNVQVVQPILSCVNRKTCLPIIL
jgi:hypothetical protein